MPQPAADRPDGASRAGEALARVHHRLVFQEEIAPVESYGVLPAAVLTAVFAVAAVVTVVTGAGEGTRLWFLRPSAVLATVIGLVGTPSLVRRRARVRARTAARAPGAQIPGTQIPGTQVPGTGVPGGGVSSR